MAQPVKADRDGAGAGENGERLAQGSPSRRLGSFEIRQPEQLEDARSPVNTSTGYFLIFKRFFSLPWVDEGELIRLDRVLLY